MSSRRAGEAPSAANVAPMLVFVPTPLGNLRDITLRAIDVLRDCVLIVSEDTRTTRRLLSALDLPSKPMLSYREQNAEQVTQTILERAASELVAVVSDAGMPGISDPGRELVVAARAAGVPVEVLPGPSAFVVAAVLSGFATSGLTFAGFVPRREGERARVLGEAIASPRTTTFYEAPSRIVATLATIERIAPEAEIFLARELTKRFEQQILGTARSVANALERPVRGEIVLVTAPTTSDAREGAPPSDDDLDAAIDAALVAGTAVAVAAKSLANRYGLERGELYRRIVERKGRMVRP